MIVANLGGFTMDAPLPADIIPEYYERIAESLSELDLAGVELIPQTMAPFPWHFGGQRYQNLFVSIDEIVDALRTLPSTPGRLETIVRESGIEVIFDGYNSNPLSLENAIDAWSMRTKLHNGQPVKRHVAILGDMLELGENEIEYHRKAGETISKQLLKDGMLITVGQLASHIRSRAGAVMIEEVQKCSLENFDLSNPTGGKHFDTTDECASELKNYVRSGDLVLIKASRGLAFEKLLSEEW